VVVGATVVVLDAVVGGVVEVGAPGTVGPLPPRIGRLPPPITWSRLAPSPARFSGVAAVASEDI
jgi:hypothetical protein